MRPNWLKVSADLFQTVLLCGKDALLRPNFFAEVTVIISLLCRYRERFRLAVMMFHRQKSRQSIKTARRFCFFDICFNSVSYPRVS
jgi:hypothetical protein